MSRVKAPCTEAKCTAPARTVRVMRPYTKELYHAVVTGYYVNHGASSDGMTYAYGRHEFGYFMCDEDGWGSWPDFAGLAAALQQHAEAA